VGEAHKSCEGSGAVKDLNLRGVFVEDPEPHYEF